MASPGPTVILHSELDSDWPFKLPPVRKIQEAEALLLVIDTSARELSRPLDIVLGLSNSLLSQVDSGSPLATDLVTIVEQIRRMNEIVSGINHLAHYKTLS